MRTREHRGKSLPQQLVRDALAAIERGDLSAARAIAAELLSRMDMLAAAGNRPAVVDLAHERIRRRRKRGSK